MGTFTPISVFLYILVFQSGASKRQADKRTDGQANRQTEGGQDLTTCTALLRDSQTTKDSWLHAKLFSKMAL